MDSTNSRIVHNNIEFDQYHKGTRGPGDQGTKGTREPGDQGTRGPGDQGTRGPGDQGTREPGNSRGVSVNCRVVNSPQPYQLFDGRQFTETTPLFPGSLVPLSPGPLVPWSPGPL